MSATQKKENLLSSWKEIASYLDCNERTCRRWEKAFGLPIHRFEGKPTYRVYAYKDELDQWLIKIFESTAVPRKVKKSSIIWRIGLFSLVFIIAAFIINFFILKESKSAKKQAPSSVPQSTGPLTLRDYDIVTTESGAAGRLRVWRKKSSNSYQEVWRIEPTTHPSVAVGNVDDKKDCEIVAPGVCLLVEEKGDRKIASLKFFLNIYKQGVKDWWKTTFYSDKDCVFENTRTHLTEIAIGDVDSEPGNEIVLITKSCLSIFKYDTQEDEFKLLRSRNLQINETPLFLKSIALGNIDNDDAEEIIIAADERTNLDGTALNKGWILVYKVQDGWPTLSKQIQVDANLAFHSLRLGDIIKGGYPEIVSPSYRNFNDMWNSYIMGWDTNGEKIFETQVYEVEGHYNKLIFLDVGNLSLNGGDEIVVGNNNTRELIFYYWDGNNLIEDSRFPLTPPHTNITNIHIANSDEKSDSLHKILVCGSGWEKPNTGRFFLEIFGYNQGFFSTWQRFGGERKEIPVSYAAFGKRYESRK
jgi:hypothetical protein